MLMVTMLLLKPLMSEASKAERALVRMSEAVTSGFPTNTAEAASMIVHRPGRAKRRLFIDLTAMCILARRIVVAPPT